MNTTKMTTHTSVIRIRLPIVLPLMSLSLSASRRTRSTARGPSRPASARDACRIERGAASMPPGRSRARGRGRAASSSRRQGLQPLSMHLLAVFPLCLLVAVQGFVHPRQTFALLRQPQSHQRAAWPQTRRWIRTDVQQGATAIVGLFVHDIGKNGGKAPAIDDRGKLAERLEVRIRPFPLCIADSRTLLSRVATVQSLVSLRPTFAL